MKTYMRPIYGGAHLCGTAVTVLLQPGDNWMLHVAAEQMQGGRRRRRRLHDRLRRRVLRRPARDELPRARRQGARHRRRRARREGPDGDAVPGVLARDQRPGHGQGDARLGEHPGGLRRRAGESGRRGASPTTTAWSWCRPPSRSRPPTRRRRARPTRRASGSSWPRACSASTCTRCASRWRRPASSTSTERERCAAPSGRDPPRQCTDDRLRHRRLALSERPR